MTFNYKITFSLLLIVAVISIFVTPLTLATEGNVGDGDEEINNSIIWEGVTCNQTGKGPCTFCDMLKVASNLVDFLTRLALVAGVAAVVGGGFMMLISGGSEERFKKGKNLVTNAVIGIVIALTAWIIVNTLFHILTGDGNAIWSEIICETETPN